MSNDNNEIPVKKRGRGRPPGAPNKRTVYLRGVLKNQHADSNEKLADNTRAIRALFKQVALGESLVGGISLNDNTMHLVKGQVLTEELIDAIDVDAYLFLPISYDIEVAFETKCSKLYKRRAILKERVSNFEDWINENGQPKKLNRWIYGVSYNNTDTRMNPKKRKKDKE